MKRLTLLRHAKSGWGDSSLPDFERALNDRGRKAARVVGQHARQRAYGFDWVVASPAVRVRETLDIFLNEIDPRPPAAIWDRRVYLASAATLIDIVRETPADIAHLLLVGHNPGIEELALMLAQGQRDMVYAAAADKYPTAALACLRLNCSEWSDVVCGCGLIERFIRPRDLDPDLGPDNNA